MIVFFLRNPSQLNILLYHHQSSPGHHIASTMLDRWCQTLLQHLLIWSVSHECFSFYWPVSYTTFSLQFCQEVLHPRVATSLLMLRQVFCSDYLMKLPVEDAFLKLDTLMYWSSCSVVHRGLTVFILFLLEPVCAALRMESTTCW